jgi:hypothetical protein
MPMLNLTEREDASFDPLPAGRYLATVHDAEERQTGGKGKLPEGTPMIWIQWKIDEPLFDYPEIGSEETIQLGEDNEVTLKVRDYENAYQFTQNVIPPEEINGEPYKNYKMMNGMIFRLLEALGYEQEQLESGDFELDYEDLKGRQAAITVSRYIYTDPDTDDKSVRNNVKGVKAAPAQSGVL